MPRASSFLIYTKKLNGNNTLDLYSYLVLLKRKNIHLKDYLYSTKSTTTVWEMALSVWRPLNNNGNHNKRNTYFINTLLVIYYIFSNHTLLIMNYICYHVMWMIMTTMYINWIKRCLPKKHNLKLIGSTIHLHINFIQWHCDTYTWEQLYNSQYLK